VGLLGHRSRGDAVGRRSEVGMRWEFCAPYLTGYRGRLLRGLKVRVWGAGLLTRGRSEHEKQEEPDAAAGDKGDGKLQPRARPLQLPEGERDDQQDQASAQQAEPLGLAHERSPWRAKRA